jgi:hypothetical protein
MGACEPFAARRAGCGGKASRGAQGHCGGVVTWVGVVFFPYPRPVLYRAFACDEHVELLDVARPLDDAGRAELERRRQRQRQRRVVVDRCPHEPEQPLAVGAQARARLAEERRDAEGWRG